MLVSAHDGGVNHHVLVVVIAGQEPENPLENAALGPSVEALIDDLPVAKALGQIAPRNAGAKPEENGFDEQPFRPFVPEQHADAAGSKSSPAAFRLGATCSYGSPPAPKRRSCVDRANRERRGSIARTFGLIQTSRRR